MEIDERKHIISMNSEIKSVSSKINPNEECNKQRDNERYKNVLQAIVIIALTAMNQINNKKSKFIDLNKVPLDKMLTDIMSLSINTLFDNKNAPKEYETLFRSGEFIIKILKSSSNLGDLTKEDFLYFDLDKVSELNKAIQNV